jgi:YVTN family beta-propeller protein
MSLKRRIGWSVAGLVTAGATALSVAVLVPSAQAGPADSATTVAADKPIPVSSHDRVYTADQTSNTVSVIDPSTNKTLGTIALGAQRLGQVLNPQYTQDVGVHGLAYSTDHKRLAVVSITSDGVDIIDTATNKVVNHTDVGRASHEGWFTNDGKQFWVAARGTDTVTIVDAVHGGVITNLPVGAGPSKVVMSPDGKLAYINHIALPEITVVDVRSHRIVDHITGLADPFASDLAISPDGRELWVPHKRAGKTTVVDLVHDKIQAVLTTGPDTNHPNFADTPAGSFAYLTVGGLDETLAFRRTAYGTPTLVSTIHTTGHAPHGIWPSGDGTRLYVGMEKSDAVDVIDTGTNKVVSTIGVAQEPQALVYVPGASPDGTAPNLGHQGVAQQATNVPTTLPDGRDGEAMDPVKGRGLEATVRPVAGLDMIQLQARGLQPNTTFRASSVDTDGRQIPVVTFQTDANGNAPQVLAFAIFTGKSIAIQATGGTDRPASAVSDMHGAGSTIGVTSADLFYCDCCC